MLLVKIRDWPFRTQPEVTEILRGGLKQIYIAMEICYNLSETKISRF